MKFSRWAFLAISTNVASACPFANSGGEMPKDHPEIDGANSRRRLGLRSLRGNAAGQEKVASVVRERVERSLQGGGCFTRGTYDDIIADIGAIFDGLAPVVDARDRGHFFGGIVRLAAHDFMDYDRNDTEFPQGADGCVDWEIDGTGADNAGLETIWCNDHQLCPLKSLYDSKYAINGVGRADFWVAAANAVIKLSSREWTDGAGGTHADLDLPFRYGRLDFDGCTGISATRLPGAQGCDQVEKTFINQMGLNWEDAVALLGAHSLGYGHAQHSGHDGMWVDEETETIVFDKRYYEELLGRAWRLRDPENTQPILDLDPHLNAPKQDWTWAGPNGGNPRFMLNADLCLAFDIETGGNCCALIRQGGDVPGETFCVDPRLNLTPEQIEELVGTIPQCPSSEDVRPDARRAVDTFAALRPRGNTLNGPFYEAFSAAWQRATEAGYSDGQLHDLADTCDPTIPPTATPTLSPTAAPTATPTVAPTAKPTEQCEDLEGTFVDNKGKNRECSWVLTETRNRCREFAYLCPATCDMCQCLLNNHRCESGDDCCSGDCSGPVGDESCQCRRKGELCASSTQCCSGECRGDGTCAGSK